MQHSFWGIWYILHRYSWRCVQMEMVVPAVQSGEAASAAAPLDVSTLQAAIHDAVTDVFEAAAAAAPPLLLSNGAFSARKPASGAGCMAVVQPPKPYSLPEPEPHGGAARRRQSGGAAPGGRAADAEAQSRGAEGRAASGGSCPEPAAREWRQSSAAAAAAEKDFAAVEEQSRAAAATEGLCPIPAAIDSGYATAGRGHGGAGAQRDHTAEADAHVSAAAERGATEGLGDIHAPDAGLQSRVIAEGRGVAGEAQRSAAAGRAAAEGLGAKYAAAPGLQSQPAVQAESSAAAGWVAIQALGAKPSVASGLQSRTAADGHTAVGYQRPNLAAALGLQCRSAAEVLLAVGYHRTPVELAAVALAIPRPTPANLSRLQDLAASDGHTAATYHRDTSAPAPGVDPHAAANGRATVEVQRPPAERGSNAAGPPQLSRCLPPSADGQLETEQLTQELKPSLGMGPSPARVWEQLQVCAGIQAFGVEVCKSTLKF